MSNSEDAAPEGGTDATATTTTDASPPLPTLSKGTKWFGDFASGLPSMANKTVVITGTTTGCGKIAAQTLAAKGARLILLNRKSERSEAALQQLKEQFPQSSVDGVECDLQQFASVRSAAQNVKELLGSEGCIDVLCNNAGVMAMKDIATSDGYDVQMQVNHLSHFLLTKELFPLIKLAAESKGEARIVNHTSVARSNPNKPLDSKNLEKNGGNLGGDGKAATWTRYQQTKLANCVFTYGLRDRFEAKESKIKAMVAHPGLARTALIANTNKDGAGFSGFIGPCLQWVFTSRNQTEEDGTMGILSCICLPDAPNGAFYGPGSTGKAFRGPAVLISPEKQLTDKDQIELLWSKSEEAIQDKFEV